MELEEYKRFLTKEHVTIAKRVIAKIDDEVTENDGRFGKEFHIPIRIPSEGNKDYVVSVWRQHLRDLEKAYGLQTNDWIGKEIAIQTVDIVNAKGKDVKGWIIKPS